MNLYLSRQGQTFGPYTVDQAREYLAAGQFFPNDHALFEGQTEWNSLGELIGTEAPQAEAEPSPVVDEPAGEEVQEVAERRVSSRGVPMRFNLRKTPNPPA